LVPGFRSLTAGGSSADDLEMFVGHSDGACDLDCLGLGVGYQLVGDLLHGGKTVAGKGDTGAFYILIFETLLLIFLSHDY